MLGKAQIIPAQGAGPIQTTYLYASAAVTKGSILKMGAGANGFEVAAIADDTLVYKPVVALENVEAGSYGLFAVAGPVVATVPSGNYTAGNGVDILNGAVRDSTAAAEVPNGVLSQNDFGRVLVGGTSVTQITILLYPFSVTAQT